MLIRSGDAQRPTLDLRCPKGEEGRTGTRREGPESHTGASVNLRRPNTDYPPNERRMMRTPSFSRPLGISRLRIFDAAERCWKGDGRGSEQSGSLRAQLAAKNPKSAGPLTMLGMGLELQNKRDEASKQYEQALRLDSQAAVAANNLASYYADNAQRLDITLDLAQTAVRQLPDHAPTVDTLGWACFMRALPALALEPFRHATQLDPKSSLFQDHLGLAYAKSGDKFEQRGPDQSAQPRVRFSRS